MQDRRSTLEGVVPILTVHDLQASLEYYTKVLDFEIAWEYGEPPYLASVFRDRVELNLSQREAATELMPSRVYFQVLDVEAYYVQVAAAGAAIDVALDERTYGMKDFRVVDPSGNELSFGEASDLVESSVS